MPNLTYIDWLYIDENIMGYINQSFLIRIALLGGTLSCLPLPVLAKMLTNDSGTVSARVSPNAQLVAEVSEEVAAVSLIDAPSTPDLLAPAVLNSFDTPAFIKTNTRPPLPPELTQLTQLPNLPTDENGEDAPPVSDESAADMADETSGEQPAGEIIPETGQAASTANEDLLEDNDLPPTELLADPNPLSVPTLESEILLKEGEEQTIALDEALELAYFNNQDLQVALLELEQAEATLAEARAAFAPVVTTSADVTAQETNSTQTAFGTVGDDGIDTTLNAAVGISYDLFTSGQRVATLRAAEEQVRLNGLEVDRRREELRLQTTNLYYDLQESGEQIRINQSFVEEAKRNRDDNELRRKAGVGTQFDVLRADVQLANAQQNLIQSESQQRIARRNLARLLNVPPSVNLNTTPVPDPDNWDDTYERWHLTLEDSILLAFQSRAELEQQLAQREIGLQQARAARAANGPQVSLFANYSWSDLLDDSADTYNFGARFNMVLADGGAARARARQQEINADIAEERFAEQLDQIRFDVEESYFTLRANEENVRTARTAIEQADTALELANLRLDAGVGTQLDVLTAQSELTQAEGNWVSAALGYNRALAALQRAVSNLRATL
ncbi:MAG: TolC family protein [Cyanobacteria bacterium P01_D01_bin.56]